MRTKNTIKIEELTAEIVELGNKFDEKNAEIERLNDLIKLANMANLVSSNTIDILQDHIKELKSEKGLDWDTTEPAEPCKVLVSSNNELHLIYYNPLARHRWMIDATTRFDGKIDAWRKQEPYE